MRSAFALIIAFLILIVFFTQWYLCEVRGLCENVAIFEILGMLLIALLIGFAGSWLVSENIFLSIRRQVGRLLKDKTTLVERVQILERENMIARKQIAEWQQEAALLLQGKKATEPLLLEAQSRVQSLIEEIEQHNRRYENLKHESDEMRETASRLKHELAEQVLRADKLKIELDRKEEKIIEEVEKKDPHHSRFTPSTKQTKNDLTLIRGIGPVIQKKLNDLGIYTFQQISELSPEMVEKITETIKFFPDRIGRDNWIGQAAALRHVR